MYVDLVICGMGQTMGGLAELANGHARQRRQWTTQRWHEAPMAGDPQALWRCALAHGADLADDALVLVLLHDQWFVADAVPGWMSAALSEQVPVALCGGPAQVTPEMPPDYCTLGGLDRYCSALARSVVSRQVTLSDAPAAPLVLARMHALRSWAQGCSVNAQWVAGCHAHDYSSYQQATRPEVVALVDEGVRRVLDIGGGEGQFLQELKAQRGCETHLSEFSAQACAHAADRVDTCWPGDFLAQSWEGLPAGGAGAFDCVTALESLEHTADTDAWLARIHWLLAEDGALVGSVPHVGHWSVLADLLQGRWDYCPVGIHCVTHLRFFTRRTLCDALNAQGFVLEELRTVIVPCPTPWRTHWLATPGLETGAAELDTYAFLFRARKRIQG